MVISYHGKAPTEAKKLTPTRKVPLKETGVQEV